MENEQNNVEENVIETFNSKCPSCGAEMVFSPDIKKLKCPFCDTTKDIDLTKYGEELDFENLMNVNNNSWSKETNVYQCKNCGVKQVVSKDDIATKCPFCGTPNVVLTEDLVGLKPNAVVPFSITKDDAVVCVKKWGKNKIFAPSSFKKNIVPEDVNGIYNPAFTFDSDTFSKYSGRLGKYHVVTKRINGKTVQTRELRYFNISGTFSFKFDDVLVEASNTIPQKYLNQIRPFDTNHSNSYDASFLLGFKANQYTKDGQVCWKDAKNTMNSELERRILSQYTYDVVGSFNVNTNYSNITYKYLLLPLYVGITKYHEKNYNFFVNGKNGKVSGKTPISVIKVGICVIIILAVFALLMYLYMEYGE